MARKRLKIGVIDFETDPFKTGRHVAPFSCEFYSEDHCMTFWGDDCALRLVNALEQLEDGYMIFAHNGGNFDFWLGLYDHVSNPIRVIANRIVSAKLFHHTLRDSFAIIPIGLERAIKGGKLKIDYRKLERDKRESNREEILRYQHQDCITLYQLVSSFIERFTAMLTVGSTAMKQLRRFHDFTRSNEKEDAIFRPFYFGGRSEAFKSGVLKGPWQTYDINSSYPKSMRDYNHPVNGNWDIEDNLPRSFKRPFFCHFIGRNDGALPHRPEETEEKLTFNKEQGEFFACSHELELALDLGLVKIDRIIEIYRTKEFIRFDDYVNYWYDEKVKCKLASDQIGELFAKFMLNSAYGKFGQNPLKYKDWYITHDIDEDALAEELGYEIASQFGNFNLYSRQAKITDSSFYDVSIAASITSASRAQLLAGLQLAIDPIYCDTDSIVCKSFKGNVSETELGAWKKEKSANYAAIAGRKLYALYNTENDPVKIASKGGKLTIKEMIDLANGNEVDYHNDAPTFSLHKPAYFINRTFRKTVD